MEQWDVMSARPFIRLYLSVRLARRIALKINTGSMHVILSAMLHSDMYQLTTMPTLYETQTNNYKIYNENSFSRQRMKPAFMLEWTEGPNINWFNN
jgi:hypothetical protein